ncbi:NAD(P)H-dependent oxidoreductase [Pontibacter akesuensis]|uniref:Predicted homoserine dehydrogenase, contains C-terminal SAF domain n=1 Tax=Pontibacter akesuensis TaxID=388950 RepID=A0A1I7KIM4_9BACT|nr:Gfo/Idh/MocA family oxidoreductase [Pontibacter akesuensis]GHA80250.1 NAD(P)-dependent oxidoreductase [Pontibacter akesuensis]SFU97298.1 Predicted homoserine dehydrogenase, contains C-terminal SAF domain [Pontibacter akesuensis]
MIIVDTALAKRQAEGNPIRVAMVGAGFMGKGIALQICKYTQGMELVAISNRTLDKARQAYADAGVQQAEEVNSIADLEENIRQGKYSITEDALLLCQAEGIDAVIEVTGAVEFGTNIALTAIQNGKHIIMMNAEVDGTVGPILKVYADKAGVVFTNADGDQPGVTMNLFRFVKGLGVKPVLCGNIKGLHDPYRNPTTQEGFAKKWGQNPAMVTSFADGSKISFEQAIIANGTGMRVAKRGMHGPTVLGGTTLKECVHSLYPLEDLVQGPGIVDYVVGAEPGPGVFVLGTHDDPIQQHYLNLYKLGEGPLYLFYTPYHLCHFEVPNTVARAVLFQDAALTPMGAPQVSVVAAAKIDLKAGEEIDGIGHYMTYGLCENADTTAAERLLPIGIAEGCVLKRDIPKDQVITYDDVVLPEGRLVDRLLQEQAVYFSTTDEATRDNVLQHLQRSEASIS